MTSIQDLVDELQGATQAITDGQSSTALAEALWHEADEWYTHALTGSGQPEEGVLAGISNNLPIVFDQAKALLDECHKKLQALIAHYTGPPPTEPAPSKKPEVPWYQNPHGDNYCAEAGIIAAGLPKRVTPNHDERTAAIVYINGRIIPGMISGGPERRDDNTRRAADLLHDAGFQPGAVEFLKYHAEIKVFAMLQERGVHNAQIAINYTPCGVERDQGKDIACDKALARLATRYGLTLTVYGTYQNNQPFKKVYGAEAQ